MSRSYRKTPVHGITTCRSEKDDKKLFHGMMRSYERTILKNIRNYDLDELIIPESPNAYMNVWSMGKDGKIRWDRNDRPRKTDLGGFDYLGEEHYWPAWKFWYK